MLRQTAKRSEQSPPATPTAVRRTIRTATLAFACAASLAVVPTTLAVAATAPKIPAPYVTTDDASDAVGGYATLNGTIKTYLSGTFYFRYGPTSAYGTNTPPTPISAASAAALEEETIPVAPGGEYHYQLVASNKTGTTYGNDQVFFTPPDAPTIGSAVDNAFLPSVLSGGVPLLLRLDSAGTITVQVYVPASVAIANHVVSSVPTGDKLVLLGSSRVNVNPFQLAYDSVSIVPGAAKRLSKVGQLTLTVQATAEANGIISDLATKTIVLKNRPATAS